MLEILGLILVGALALFMVFRRKERASKAIPRPIHTSIPVTNSVTVSVIKPVGPKIQVLRAVTKRGWGVRTLKFKYGPIVIERKFKWPEAKTWNEWCVLALVDERARTVVVRYPDGREQVVKKSRTRPA